ncbi:MAG: phosphate signaling complex protein PhoU [Labrys sp. (in: a-proteobacteria)]
MSDHIVTSFDQELRALRNMIAEMGGYAEKALVDSVNALIKRDAALAQRVIALDGTVDALQASVEERAILLIARRQPMATDLREVISAIRVSNDLERIGDLAKNIAKRVVALNGQTQPAKFFGGFDHMADLVLDQLKQVLDAYAQRNFEVAAEVWRSDGAIDAMYTSLFRELLTYMMEDPRNIGFCTHLLFCAKNIERIGDHATNIAETVHYLATGETLAGERPKNDTSSFTSVEYVKPTNS